MIQNTMRINIRVTLVGALSVLITSLSSCGDPGNPNLAELSAGLAQETHATFRSICNVPRVGLIFYHHPQIDSKHHPIGVFNRDIVEFDREHKDAAGTRWFALKRFGLTGWVKADFEGKPVLCKGLTYAEMEVCRGQETTFKYSASVKELGIVLKQGERLRYYEDVFTNTAENTSWAFVNYKGKYGFIRNNGAMCPAKKPGGGEVSEHGFSWPMKSRRIEFQGCGDPWWGSPRTHGTHDGIDIKSNQRHEEVFATKDGTYSWGVAGGYGNAVTVGHGNGYSTYYAHLSTGALVSYGAWVSRGQVIGRSGTSGNARGCDEHLHFEVLINGHDVNPLLYLPPR